MNTPNTKTQHTPTPWHLEPKDDTCFPSFSIGGKRFDRRNQIIVNECEPGGELEVHWANAAFIVRACNAHEALLQACKAMENVFAATERAKAGLRDFAVCDLQSALKQARAAIALAEKGAVS